MLYMWSAIEFTIAELSLTVGLILPAPSLVGKYDSSNAQATIDISRLFKWYIGHSIS